MIRFENGIPIIERGDKELERPKLVHDRVYSIRIGDSNDLNEAINSFIEKSEKSLMDFSVIDMWYTQVRYSTYAPTRTECSYPTTVLPNSDFIVGGICIHYRYMTYETERTEPQHEDVPDHWYRPGSPYER